MTDEEILQVAHEVSDVTADTRFRITFSFDNHGLITFARRIAALEAEPKHTCPLCKAIAVIEDEKTNHHGHGMRG